MADQGVSGKTAIVGLGMTEMTRRYTKSASSLAQEALVSAADDAGLKRGDIDGLLTIAGISGGMELDFHVGLGLRDLKLRAHMNSNTGGSNAGMMLQYAALAIQAGMADVVGVVLGDAPITPGATGATSYIGRPRPLTGQAGLNATYGFSGAPMSYALAARRHMALYGTTQDHLGSIAVSNRKWAEMTPNAIYRDPLTLEDYHASRWIAEPFHILDCCMVNNGAVAVIVTSSDRARDLKQPPVYILGMGQGYPGNPRRAGYENEVNTGAVLAKETTFRMAGIGVEDVDFCEFYDCFTYATLVTLEDYGICGKGEGGFFAAEGRLGPGGSMPTNTGGGHLSGFYLWGMTPISEAVIQARARAVSVRSPSMILPSSAARAEYLTIMLVSPLARTLRPDRTWEERVRRLQEMVQKPVPEAYELWQPFFDGARNGQLMIQRCQGCEAYHAPGTVRCTECWSESLAWVQASGQGTLFTYSIIHHVSHPGFRSEVPFVIAVVELDEGPRLNTNIGGGSNSELQVGMTVQVAFEALSDEISVPKFHPT